jgi:hypothetical protein
MKTNIRRTLLAASLVLNIFMGATLLYDYLLGDSRLVVYGIVAYLVFGAIALVVVGFMREENADIRYVEIRQVPGPIQPPQPARQREIGSSPPTPAPLAKTQISRGPFRYEGYTLYSKQVKMKNNAPRDIFFFAKTAPKSGRPIAKPEGYHVGVNERTGLPFLKRGPGLDGENLTPKLVTALRPQCSALTSNSEQCRRSARAGSRYCSGHFGYQPVVLRKAEVARVDTKPHVKGARDTLPSVRHRGVN